ncbi:ROK family transcriptional regulator [Oceanobacillus alkalisoli]|uniref:ROK family transcriptional regulator n=1 Tax=Oceanobacillus alkalisoli TaxID=2925113 RepID=UPI001EF10D2C|nr:ROK family protein [Oceanobacillus alkalisoli]MCF3942910.1 ROK family transcriptional regulator [Oceanobacillus alkalisoli]MCG5102350.1 ROK family transcriptional regulator [Oceanobacillus alkalisoli]
MKISKTWNQQVVKQENKALVLEKIIENSPISRADIATSTGLNKGTVSSLVKELLDENLINESGPGKSSGGRRPVMLHFNKLAGYSIGIDLGVNYILGVLTDLKGNICLEKQINFSNLTYEEILEKLNGVIDHLMNDVPPSPYGIVGIGIGVPGIVNKEKKILLAPNLSWRNVDLKAELENRYEVPITIENEANAGAYGEKNFGVGQDFNNIIYVSVGIGIGVGLILNGNLYRGNNGFSGELGHMTIELNGMKCSCGNAGCWELYASERSLIMNAERSNFNQEQNDHLSLETILELANNGESTSIQLFEQIGKYLGVGMNNIINTFNPEQVIIGNRMAEAEQWIKQPLIDSIQNQSLWYSQQDLKIDFSNLRTHSTALGVAAFSAEAFLNNNIHHQRASGL